MRTNLGKTLALIGLVVVTLIALLWFVNHASVEINVSNPSGSSINYSFIDQDSGTTKTSLKSNAPKIKKTIASGRYQVVVQQGSNSFVSFIKTKRFLGKTVVTASLQAEKSRQFVGNNPQACMNLVKSLLVSYTCRDTYNNVKIHVPAISGQPTYATANTDKNASGTIEGIINATEGNLALIYTPANPDAKTAASHSIYRLNGSATLTSTKARALTELNTDKTYSIKPYKSGFVVYDDAFEQIMYYASTGTAAISVDIPKPETKGFSATTLNTSGDSITVTYSNNIGGDTDASPKGGPKIVVAVYKDGHAGQFTFDGQYAGVRACGNQKLCLLKDKTLEIQDISHKKLSKLFSIPNVSGLESLGSDLLAINDSGVLHLNIDSAAGFMEYSFGSYKYCGLQVDDNGYLLCLTNSKGKNVALHLDQGAASNDSIDKKVAELEKLPEVKNVSAYRQYVFISPNLGDLVYNNSLQAFDYNPVIKKSVGNTINQTIDKIGIDRNAYTIINTSE